VNRVHHFTLRIRHAISAIPRLPGPGTAGFGVQVSGSSAQRFRVFLPGSVTDVCGSRASENAAFLPEVVEFRLVRADPLLPDPLGRLRGSDGVAVRPEDGNGPDEVALACRLDDDVVDLTRFRRLVFFGLGSM
jgi:hypothetical protein